MKARYIGAIFFSIASINYSIFLYIPHGVHLPCEYQFNRGNRNKIRPVVTE